MSNKIMFMIDIMHGKQYHSEPVLPYATFNPGSGFEHIPYVVGKTYRAISAHNGEPGFLVSADPNDIFDIHRFYPSRSRLLKVRVLSEPAEDSSVFLLTKYK